MKKLNRKGFVLAEAIVVAVFVLGMFTYLAVNIIPLITKYEQALKYDNPQEVYAANILLDELNAVFFQGQKYSCKNALVLPPNGQRIALSDTIVDTAIYYPFYQQLKSDFKIKKIQAISWNSNIKCDGLERGLKEYCEYLKNKQYPPSAEKMQCPSNVYNNKKVCCYRKNILIEFENGKFSNFVAQDCEIKNEC